MPGQAEQTKQYHVSRAFRSLNTKAHRTAIHEDEFSWLENVQPIGPANLKVVPNINNLGGTVILNSSVSALYNAEIKGNTYIVALQNDGSGQAYDVNNGLPLANVGGTGMFPPPSVATQFSNTNLVIGTPNSGLYTWDGTNTVALGSGGAIAMSNVGSGYTAPPTVAVSAPDQANGVQATAEAVLVGNTVSEIVWTNPGTGYLNPPTITITGGGGTGASAVASVLSFKTGQVYYELMQGGSGYTHGNVTVTGGGGDGTAQGQLICANGVVTNIIPTHLGNGYTNTANLVVTVSGDGSGAVVKAFAEANTVNGVATYAGRLWVAQGRQMLYSGATNFNDFVGISAGSFLVNDSTLHGNILGLLAANNFLYFYGDDSINVVSDVLVSSTGTTNLTDTNVSSSIGSNLPHSLLAYYRYVLSTNQSGVYGLIGSTSVKLSDALDGIFPLIDWTHDVSAGQVIIHNILCACLNFKCLAGLPFSNGVPRWVQAVFFDKKWFMTNQGALNFIEGSPVGGTLGLYGSTDTNPAQLVRLYGDTTFANIETVVQTALLPLTDPIRDKQMITFGVEAIISAGGGEIDLTIDNPVNSSAPYALTNLISWVNNTGIIIPWDNNSGAVIGWSGGVNGYFLYARNADQPPFAPGQPGSQKYLGFTITSNTANLTYCTFEMEYELRARF